LTNKENEVTKSEQKEKKKEKKKQTS